MSKLLKTTRVSMNTNKLFGASVLNKFLSVIIITILLISPVAPVFAEEAQVDTAPAADSPVVAPEQSTSETPSNADSSITKENVVSSKDNADFAPKLKTQNSTVASSSAPTTTTQPVEDNVSKSVKPIVDESTGALVYKYALDIPNGINGLNPKVKISYNSQDNKNDSWLGYGWNVDIPYIQRVNKHGTDQLYSGAYNDFASSDFGELVSVGGNTYMPKSASDIVNLTFANNSWKYTDKTGTTYSFGSTSGARQDDSSGGNIFKWMLDTITDSNGNAIYYTYIKDQGQIYPYRIGYSTYQINFNLSSRTDVTDFYQTGFLVRTSYSISKIDILKVVTQILNPPSLYQSPQSDSTLLKSYNFSYNTGANGVRALLSSITPTGYSDNGIQTTLPPITFTYSVPARDNGTFYDATKTITKNGFFPASAYDDKSIIIGDVNGDAYSDILRAYEFTAGNYYSNKLTLIYDPESNVFNSSSIYTPPAGIMNYSANFYDGYDGGTRMLDLNGDGLSDLIRTQFLYDGSFPDVEINNSSGWTTKSASSTPSFYTNYMSNPWYPIFSNDFNGDGLVDYLQDVASATRLSINKGNGFDNQSLGGITPEFVGNGDYLMFDINGDGLADFIKSYRIDSCVGGNMALPVNDVYINKGNLIWALDNSYKLPTDFVYSVYPCNASKTNIRILVSDFNNDGLVDIFVPSYNMIYINQGKSFTLEPTSGNVASSIMIDLNADNSPDFIYGSSQMLYSSVKNQSDILSTITLSTGAKTQIEYKSSAQYKNGIYLLNPHLPLIIQTVKSITTTEPVNNVSMTSNYIYSGGSYYYNDAYNRKFAGFNVVTETDANGNTTKTYYHQGNASDSANGEYNDSYAKIGNVYRVEKYDSANNLYSVNVNKWDEFDLGNGAKFVKLARATTMTYDGTASHRDTAEEYSYDNTYGNLISKISWGEVTANADGSFTDVGADKSTETITYALNTGNGVVGLPYDDTVVDQSSNKVRETRTYYDTLALGSVGVGNATKVEQWKIGATYVNTQKTYNTTYGIVTSSTDERGKVTNYVYDAYNLYPATVTDPMNHATQYVYDYAAGKVKQTTDQNGFVYQTDYDGFGRVLSEKIPDLISPYTPVLKTSYVYNDTANAVSVQRTDYLDGSNSVDSYQYFDGLGRLIQDRREAEIAGNFNVSDTTYNSLGLVRNQSLKYVSIGSAKTTPTIDATLYTNYAYDPMQRASLVTNALGSTGYSYNLWKTTITDANGKVKNYYKDAYGNLTKVEEINSGNTYATNYTWDLNGKLTKITDALLNVRNFTYDGLGRRLTAEDLHASADSTFGTWTYTYDDAGNTIQTLDPKSQTINYTYDNINRPLTEDYTGNAGTEVTYVYDSCTNGIGKLCAVTMTSGANSAYTYDALGNTATETKTINSIANTTAYTYDRQGNQTTITYPDNAQAKYTFNTAGLLEKIERKENGGAFTDVTSNFDYNPMGQVVTQADANGVTTINTYDAAKLYRITRKLTQNAASTKLQDLNYTYDPVGNITQLIDASNTDSAKTANYIYDDLYRLKTATITSVAAGQNTYTQAFTYDALGNILTKAETIGANPTITSTYSYTGNTGANYANPHAVTTITDGTNTTTYTYDNNGNLTTDGSKSYTFDYNNHLIQASISSTPTIATFSPMAGDGSTYRSDINWTTDHNATSATSTNYTLDNFTVRTGRPGTDYLIQRAFLPFDTSPLPDNAVITDTKLKVFVASTQDSTNDTNDFITLAQGSEQYPTVLNNADYDNAGAITNPTEGINLTERKDITNVPSNAYLTFNLNPTGQSWILKNAPTKLALREGHDAKNIPITGTAGSYDSLNIRSVEYAGTSSDPILEVTYTVPTTITYKYDQNGNRVSSTNGANTISYPNKLYTYDSTTKTKDIYSNNTLIASTTTVGAIVSPYYVHTDHLNSTNVTTDTSGAQIQLLDYFPYGNTRINSGSPSNQRQYVGQKFDTDTGLNYLNARYYNSSIGKFVSEDPEFWVTSQTWLLDPQNQNSYAYARNNPVNLSDPGGRSALGNAITAIKNAWNNLMGNNGNKQISSATVSQQPAINYGPNVNKTVISTKTQSVIGTLMIDSKQSTPYTITSTYRTPEKQAQIMANNASQNGIQSQYKLYGSSGDKILDLYPDVGGMTKKIYEIGPGNVSSHMKDPNVVNVFDIDPKSVNNADAFRNAVKNNTFIDQKKFFYPPNDPAFHLEVPQQ